MTRLWKRKNHEYPLVLTVLILIQTCWTFDKREIRKLNFPPKILNSNELSYVEIVIGTNTDAETLGYYLSRWNDTRIDTTGNNDVIYYGEGLQDVFFHSSAKNSSLTLKDLSRCTNDLGFITCLKLLLVNRLDDLLDYLKVNNLTKTDFSIGNGIVNFKSVPGVNVYEERSSGAVGLDEDITQKVMELFKDRSLKVNLLPGLELELKPKPGKTPEEFIRFQAKPYLKWFRQNDDNPKENEGRSGNNKRKNKGGFKMPSMMMLSQLVMMGFMPFALANVQSMVMNAFMMNMMALNGIVVMIIRDLVFGPRKGPNIKYVNYGYRKKKKNVPTIIVHSPAAFVKQPFHLIHRHKKPFHHHHHHHPPHFHQIDQHHEDHPLSFHKGIKSFKPEIINHEEFYDEHSEGSHINHKVEVFREDGELDGKNRVRIRINEINGPSVKEVLHRIRTIENEGKKFHPWSEYDYQEGPQTGYSASEFSNSGDNNTPWTATDQSDKRIFQ